jgi:ABC-2 type transport system ATP-binding protein
MDKVLVVDGLTKEYPGRTVVSNVSFEVNKGSIHGFLGPNGAGKSTTMKMISGLTSISSGSVSIMGQKVDTKNLQLKNLVGLLPENAPLYPDLSVQDYLKLVAKLHHVKKVKDQVDKVIEDLSLIEVRKRLIGNLSKGFKQRVGLAQAIVYNAPFLILDEPTNGLDPQSVVELREFIKKLSKEKTILFSSHVLPEVEQLCDQVTIIHRGKIRASGSLHDIHKKFRQGLVLKIGISENQNLPSLDQFGKHDIQNEHVIGHERQYHIVFEEDNDNRSAIAKYLFSKQIDLLTMQIDSPELEDIFLHVTENKK